MFALANYGGRFNSQILEVNDISKRLAIFASFVLVALISSAIILAITVGAEALFTQSAKNYFFSAAVMLGALGAVFAFLRLFEPINSQLFGLPLESLVSSSLYSAINLIVGSLILTALFRYEQKILERLSFATRLATKLDDRQKQLIEAEERQKGQTSRFLHDRVQAELMVISVQLAAIEKSTTGETFEGLEAIRARLEKLRRVDLRLVSNALQPNIKELGLKAAVDDLLDQFAAGIAFEVQIDDSRFRENTQICLGIYRILEQAIVNSITHGPASAVKISVGRQGDATCIVSIEDDGPGAQLETIEPGLGTALIDSWVSILKATKVVSSAPGEGYSLAVTIAI